MEATTFNKFRALIYETSGITLGHNKESLVSARIAKRMRTLGIQRHRDYLEYVETDKAGEEIVHLIDAISTNVTGFFREAEHFRLVQNLVARWWEQGQTRFRFWSAASSTGEEPYSLAIAVTEGLDGATADARILATDISTRVLQKCREACYSADKIENVPVELRRYFDAQREAKTPVFGVKPALRQMITFQRLNLAQPPFPMRGLFDIVLCRNVMIYFDNAIRARLLKEIHRLLKPGGYLMVGHAESLTGMLSPFKSIQPSVYQKE